MTARAEKLLAAFKAFNAFKIVNAAVLAVALLAGPGGGRRALAAEPVALAVDPMRSLGAVPRLFRPSAMLAWADRPAVERFLALPGPIGAVRVTLEPLLSNAKDFDDYTRQLRAAVPALRQLAARDAAIIVTFARMPRWLASRQDESLAGSFGFTVREASPPRDYGVLEDLAAATVRIINKEGGLSPYYEFWNEPDAKSFWVGRRDELFLSYAAFARGVKRADPNARVGGLAFGGWNVRRDGDAKDAPAMIEDFIAFSARPPAKLGMERLPIDFLSWHNFAPAPETGWGGAAEIVPWLTRAGYPADTPQIISEWNRWASFDQWRDDARDGALGAAYVAGALHAMDRAGIALQTIAALQDFNEPEGDEVFIGGFGLLTRRPIVEKASFQVMKMLSRFGRERVAADLSRGARSGGIDAIATLEGNRLVIMIHRFAGDSLGAFIRSLQQEGFRRFEEIGLPIDRLTGFIQRRVQLAPDELPPKTLRALEQGRQAAEQASREDPGPVPIALTLPGSVKVARYEIYLVDETHGNPGAAFKRARDAGRGIKAALAAAVEQSRFKPVSSGRGVPAGISLGRYAVALVVLDLVKP